MTQSFYHSPAPQNSKHKKASEKAGRSAKTPAALLFSPSDFRLFGDEGVKSVEAVWAQWNKIKKPEKQGTGHERTSALDGIQRHLPALLKAEKLVKKARKAKLRDEEPKPSYSKAQVASQLLSFTAYAQSKGWSAEELLRSETENVRKKLLKVEASRIS